MARLRNSWDLRGTTDVFLIRNYISLPNDSARAQVYNAVNPTQPDIGDQAFWNHYSNRFRLGSTKGGFSPDWIEVCNLDGHLTQQEMDSREQTQWRPRLDEMVNAAHALGYGSAEYIQGGMFDSALDAQLTTLRSDAAHRTRVLRRSRHLLGLGLAASNTPVVPDSSNQTNTLPTGAMHRSTPTPADPQNAASAQAQFSSDEQEWLARANTLSPNRHSITEPMNGATFDQAEQQHHAQHDLPFFVPQQELQGVSNPGHLDPQSRRVHEQHKSALEPVHAPTSTDTDQQSFSGLMTTQTQGFASLHQEALLARKHELLQELQWIDAALAGSTDMRDTLEDSQPATIMDQVSLEHLSADWETRNKEQSDVRQVGGSMLNIDPRLLE